MRRLLVLFAREPIAGRVKTRLAASLGEARSAALYAAFLSDLDAALRSGSWGLRVACAEGLPAPALAALLPRWERIAQEGADLGARMAAAFADGFRQGRERVAVAGSDAPLLSSRDVAGGFDALDSADAAFAPAPDGGFSLVALRAGVDAAALFAGVRWSTEHALSDCRARARELGLRAATLPEVPDVDVPRDVDLLRLRLAERPDAAPATARLLLAWEAA